MQTRNYDSSTLRIHLLHRHFILNVALNAHSHQRKLALSSCVHWPLLYVASKCTWWS